MLNNVFINWLKQDNLEQILEFLLKEFPEDTSDIIQLMGRLSSLNLEKNKGILDYKESSIERNKIRDAIGSYLKSNEKIDYEAICRAYSMSIPKLFFYNLLSFIVSEYFILRILFLITILICFGMVYKVYKLPKPTIYDRSRVSTRKTEFAASAFLNNAFIEQKMTAYDNKGKKVEMVIFLIKGFIWKLGKSEETERFGQDKGICEHIKEIGVIERINDHNLKAITCFGNTSVEEPLHIPEKERAYFEENRADVRAKKLAGCVSPVLKTSTPVYTCNLGQYTKKDKVTMYQREIILVGIIRNEEDSVNEEALFNGLKDKNEIERWTIDIRLFSKLKDKNSIELNNFIN